MKNINDEVFTANGITVEHLNYLEIWTYEKWSDCYIPQFKKGEKFTPTYFWMETSETTPPKLLTESDLISLMDKNGIGTDATIHEHIQTVQDRNYVVKVKNEFIPTPQGVSLVEVYQEFDLKLYKPYLRAQMEKEMTMIANGVKSKDVVLSEWIKEMYRIFENVVSLKDKMMDVLKSKYKMSSDKIEETKGISHADTDYENHTAAPQFNNNQGSRFYNELDETEFCKCPEWK